MTRAVTRRTTLGGLLALAAIPATGRAASCPPTRILFVCAAGTVNSPIAREQIKQSARTRGVALAAQSRGVHLEEHLTPALEAQLRRDGIDARSEPIRALASSDIAGADIVVAFNEAAQAPGLERARSWSVPSWTADYAAAKAELTRRTDALLDELAARGCAPN